MEQSSRARPGDGAVIYQSTILTMDPMRPTAEAVIVDDGVIVDLGSIDDLVQAYPGASFDERFLRKTLLPAIVDVRVPPNALKVLQIPCQGDVLTEDVVSMGADGAPVRLVAVDRIAFDAALEAVAGVPKDAALGRVSVEARGPVAAERARKLLALGAPLILSGDEIPEGCEAAADAEDEPVDPLVSGRIALAPAAGDTAFLAAAGIYLQNGGTLRLSALEALEAITADAAFVLGAENERGVLAPGRRADFAVLDRNPLATRAEGWAAIGVEAYSAGTPE
jgi:hypothetical protein